MSMLAMPDNYKLPACYFFLYSSLDFAHTLSSICFPSLVLTLWQIAGRILAPRR